MATFRCTEGHQSIAYGPCDDCFDGSSLCRTEGLFVQESQVLLGCPAQTALLLKRMRHCPIGSSPLVLGHVCVSLRLVLEGWQCTRRFGNLQQCEVLFAGKTFLSFHAMFGLECILSWCSLTAFLRWARRPLEPVIGRFRQSKAPGPYLKVLIDLHVGRMSDWCSKQCEDEPW